MLRENIRFTLFRYSKVSVFYGYTKIFVITLSITIKKLCAFRKKT